MSKIIVSPKQPLGRDERGETSELELDRKGKCLFAFRKAGSISGNHYHKGIEENKNPEILWILFGKVKISYRETNDSIWHEQEINGPCKVEIFPNTIHILTGITDFGMLELNSLQEHQNDTFRE